MFGKQTPLARRLKTVPVKSASERKTCVLGAYNAGEGRIATAQRLAQRAGKDPQVWRDVEAFLEAAGADAQETSEYVRRVPLYEAEFAQKSPANKKLKQKAARKAGARCTVGHWVTIDDRPVFICA